MAPKGTRNAFMISMCEAPKSYGINTMELQLLKIATAMHKSCEYKN